jgi:hypothetical protein
MARCDGVSDAAETDGIQCLWDWVFQEDGRGWVNKQSYIAPVRVSIHQTK